MGWFKKRQVRTLADVLNPELAPNDQDTFWAHTEGTYKHTSYLLEGEYGDPAAKIVQRVERHSNGTVDIVHV